MADNDYFPLDEVSDDLSPLPTVHRQGLTAIAVLAALSFVSCTAVLLYLTAKLGRWHLRTWRQAREAGQASPAVDLSLGLAEQHFMGDGAKSSGLPPRKKAHINQFLILIYNLLLADIHQAASFLLNGVWVGRDRIQVRTATCWAQGYLVQTGDVASSLFITAIAIHTYLAIVRNYTPPQWTIYTVVVTLWVFNYLLMVIGIAVTKNGREVGGFFVRASAWCWINVRYEGLRLYLHYLWIFIALAITAIFYTLIFFSLRKKRLLSAQPGLPATTDSSTNIHDTNPSTTTRSSSIHKSHPEPTITANTNPHHHHQQQQHEQTEGNHKAFLLYPLIYILCTLPLALGRIASMAGAEVPIAYFCTAGALITSNGWLDVLLWGVTRHSLLFNGDVDTEDSGLDTFAFMRTPHGRRWGNMVWVEGGGNNPGGDKTEGGEGGRRLSGLGLVKRRMGWRPLGFGGSGNTGGGAGTRAGAGQEEERARGGARREEGLAIQMDMVTTVVVEPAAVETTQIWNRGGSRRLPPGEGRPPVYESDSADDGLPRVIS